MIGLRSGRQRTGRRFAHSAFTTTLSGSEFAPLEARRSVAEFLEDDIDGDVLDVVKLLISETVTNCVRHAHTGAAGDIDVRVTRLPSAVRAEVTTAGPGFEIPLPPEPPSPGGAGGRGLQLVELLSSRWGIRAHANSVWFEVGAAAS